MMVLDDESSQHVDEVCCCIFERFPIEYLMELVRNNSDDVYLLMHREDRNFIDIYIGKNNKDFGEFIAILVPKRFAVFEPDKNYFELTLKANVAMALRGVRDFHL